MKDGFIKVAAATPHIQVADCEYNREQIWMEIQKVAKEKVKLLVLPELCLTGYTCGDLFLQETLLQGAKEGLDWLLAKTKDISMIIVVGLPFSVDCKLYNVAAFCYRGELLGMIPKRYMPNYSEFYEVRHFTEGNSEVKMIPYNNQQIPFGTRLLFRCKQMPEFVIC